MADKYDRRWVLIWLSVAAMASCGVTAFSTEFGTMGVMLAAGLFGLTTFPIYSAAAAHAHDFASSEERVELSAALMFYFAAGAIFAPYLASVLIESYGPMALFTLISIAHAGLVVFDLIRMRARSIAKDRTRYVYAQRTTFQVGRLLGKSREDKPRDP